MDSNRRMDDDSNGLYQKYKIRITENQFLRKICLKFFHVFLCSTVENGAENEWKIDFKG